MRQSYKTIHKFSQLQEKVHTFTIKVSGQDLDNPSLADLSRVHSLLVCVCIDILQ